MAYCRILLSCLAVVAAGTVFSQPLPEPKNGISLKRLYSFPTINGRSPSGAAMSPDGSKIIFGWNKTGERRLDVWMMDYPSGATRQLFAANDIPRFPRQEDNRTELQKREEELYDGGFSNFQWSPDSKTVMGSYRGRVWLFDAEGKNRRPLFDTQEQVSSPVFSPDGTMIAYVRGGNLHRVRLADGNIKQLTFVSGPGTVDGFTWSPDSKQLAVTWSDSSRMGRHVMMDFTKQRAEVVNIGRMWTGERSVNMQVGIVPAEGGLIKFVPRLPRYIWMTELQWSPDSKWLSMSWIKEDFQEYTLTAVFAETMSRVDVYTEKAPSKYIPDFRNHFWSRDGKKIFFTTDIIDGKWANRSLMSVDPRRSGSVEKVYAKNHDIAAAGRPLDSDRIILVTQKRSGLMTEITILEPDGRETEHNVMPNGVNSPTAFDEAVLPMFSRDGTKIATLANDRTINPELYSLEPSQKRLTTSQLADFAKIEWADYTPVSFPGPDGRMISAVLITKKGLDKTKKHPAFISSMYANSGKMSWGGYLENYAAVELGMVVLQVDFRASWGYGGEFNAGYHKSMGVIDSDEAVKAHEYLVSTGFVRGDRVGVWGWSYGGYLTCMIMLTRPGVFDTGVAVASVTDWRQYNEWYVRRRLGLPSEDADVFVKTSPVHHAKGLQGNLLIVHGMLDDNVLFQDSVQLKQKLIEEGKSFDQFAYPRGDHGMWRVDERPHIQDLILRYLYNHLNRP